MKRIKFLCFLILFIFFSTVPQSNAATVGAYYGGATSLLNWENDAITYYNNYFTIDIPSDLGTLVAGTPLYTPFPGKYITFDQDLTFTANITDTYTDPDTWVYYSRSIDMLDTENSESLTMTLHGFSVLGFGYEIQPNSSGWYGTGFMYGGKSASGSVNGDYPPAFWGRITDGEGEDDMNINQITIFTNTLSNPDYPQDPTGFYLGDLHFVENSPVPVPGSILILGVGLLGLAGVSRRKKNN